MAEPGAQGGWGPTLAYGPERARRTGRRLRAARSFDAFVRRVRSTRTLRNDAHGPAVLVDGHPVGTAIPVVVDPLLQQRAPRIVPAHRLRTAVAVGVPVARVHV